MRTPQVIALGGILAGTLDILAAFAMSWPRVGPTRVLQAIASGLLGPAAFQGGSLSAALGLMLHFVIAIGAAAVYVAASLQWAALWRRPVACGLIYGVAVYLVMNVVVLPLSRVGGGWPAWPTVARLVVVHMLCVGLPIALVTARARTNRSPR